MEAKLQMFKLLGAALALFIGCASFAHADCIPSTLTNKAALGCKPLAVSPSSSDYLVLWQPNLSGSTRLMSFDQMAAKFLSLSDGGTVSGLLTLDGGSETDGNVILAPKPSGDDDYSALSASLTALCASNTGGTLQLQAGTYKISQPIVSPACGSGYSLITLKGVGSATIISPSTTMDELISVTNKYFDISDLELVNVSSDASAGIVIAAGKNDLPERIRRVTINSFATAIDVTSGDNLSIEDSFFNSDTVCLSLTDTFNDSISGNYMLGCSGINFPVPGVHQAEGIRIISNTILPGLAGTYALQILGGLEIEASENIFDQVETGAGVIIDNTNASISDVKLSHSWIGGNATSLNTTDGIKVIGGSGIKLDDLTIAGWQNGYGVNADGTEIVISNSQFADTSGTCSVLLASSAPAVLTGNRFANTTCDVSETGTTKTKATANWFVGSVTAVSTSQYYENEGNSDCLLSSVDTDAAVTIGSRGTATNCATTITSKGSSGIIMAPNNVSGIFFPQNGHLASTGTAPTLSACGTSPTIGGTDTKGLVTVGTGTVTSCTVTFAHAYTTAPVCWVASYASGITASIDTVPSTTKIIVTLSATDPSGQFGYGCIQ